jgi:hypothetical protein
MKSRDANGVWVRAWQVRRGEAGDLIAKTMDRSK